MKTPYTLHKIKCGGNKKMHSGKLNHLQHHQKTELSQKTAIEYNVTLGIPKKDAWDVYARQPISCYSQKYKVHFSFDQEKLELAKKLILTILKKHGVHFFKLIHSKTIHKKNIRYANVNSKELTIYLQFGNRFAPENEPRFWLNVFNELESTFQKNGIDPNPIKPQADIPFAGSLGYIFYRAPYNIIDRYIMASSLNQSGFTRIEASSLTDDRTFQNKFNHYRLHEDENFIQPFSHDHHLKKQRAAKKYQLNKINEYEIKKIEYLYKKDILSAKLAFFGIENNSYTHIAQLFEIALGINFSIDKSNLMYEIAKPLEVYIATCLREAAEAVATLWTGFFGKKTAVSVGNIAPIIYHYFLFPALKLAKEMSALPYSQMVKVIMEEIKKDRDKFIAELIKCSFRLRNTQTMRQIEHDMPQYIDRINEEQIVSAHQHYKEFKKTSFTLINRFAFHAIKEKQKTEIPHLETYFNHQEKIKQNKKILIENIIKNFSKATKKHSLIDERIHYLMQEYKMCGGSMEQCWAALVRLNITKGKKNDADLDLLYRAMAECDNNLNRWHNITTLEQLISAQQKRDVIDQVIYPEIYRLLLEGPSQLVDTKIRAYQCLIKTIINSREDRTLTDILAKNSLEMLGHVIKEISPSLGQVIEFHNKPLTIQKALNLLRGTRLPWSKITSKEKLNGLRRTLSYPQHILLKLGIEAKKSTAPSRVYKENVNLNSSNVIQQNSHFNLRKMR